MSSPAPPAAMSLSELSETNVWIPWPAKLDYQHQSVEVPGTRRPGQTGHYQNGAFGLISLETPHIFRTVSDIWASGLRLGKNERCLGFRPVLSANPLKLADHYVWETYPQVDARRKAVGSALTALFRDELKADGLETVGIWSTNRPEWQIVDLAAQTYGKVGVALYDTLGKDAVEHIINHSHSTVVFTTANHISELLKMAPRTACLKMLVCMDELSVDGKNLASTWAATQGIVIKTFQEIEELGKANLAEPPTIRPEQVASLCYTSGTTGLPKGVVLKHSMNALSTHAQLIGTNLPAGGCMISYLPLAHIYERLVENVVFAIGGAIGFFSGDPLRLLEDCQILKPQLFPSVPRLLNRIYLAAMAGGNVPGLKGAIFRRAMAVKLARLHATGINTHALWDRIVFKKIQAVLGGGIVAISCGAAPINPDVMEFLNVAFGCYVFEGYGMTENTATCTRTWYQDKSAPGTVGPPQAVCEIKLVDVPAMSYTAEDKPHPRGEICVRGPNCLGEYYKDEAKTKETVDEDGWLRTGDVGIIDDCGRLKIIDRVKNIMKLAQGEYVALEKIENLHSACPLVQQLYVHGEGLQTYLLGVVVPDPVAFAALASGILGRQIPAEDTADLALAARDPRINEAVLHQLTKEGKKSGLKGFEMIKRIHISVEPFTVDNGCMTPTLKIVRKGAAAKFQAELAALYALGDPPSSSAKM